jgi:hypothetical protein
VLGSPTSACAVHGFTGTALASVALGPMLGGGPPRCPKAFAACAAAPISACGGPGFPSLRHVSERSAFGEKWYNDERRVGPSDHMDDRMRRREFIALVGGAAVAPQLLWPVAASVQEAGKVHRIGFWPIAELNVGPDRRRLATTDNR